MIRIWAPRKDFLETDLHSRCDKLESARGEGTALAEWKETASPSRWAASSVPVALRRKGPGRKPAALLNSVPFFLPSLWLSSFKSAPHLSSFSAGHIPVPWWGLFYWTTTVHWRARRWRGPEQTAHRLPAQHPAQRALDRKACVWHLRYFLPAPAEPPALWDGSVAILQTCTSFTDCKMLPFTLSFTQSSSEVGVSHGAYVEATERFSNLSKVAQLRTNKAPIGAHLTPGSL